MNVIEGMFKGIPRKRLLTQTGARRWVTALRSGKYKQGKNRLCTDNFDGSKSFCCLGVLREIRPGCDAGGEAFIDYAVLPSDLQGTLAGLNDSKGWSFNRIAGYVERYIIKHLPK